MWMRAIGQLIACERNWEEKKMVDDQNLKITFLKESFILAVYIILSHSGKLWYWRNYDIQEKILPKQIILNYILQKQCHNDKDCFHKSDCHSRGLYKHFAWCPLMHSRLSFYGWWSLKQHVLICWKCRWGSGGGGEWTFLACFRVD